MQNPRSSSQVPHKDHKIVYQHNILLHYSCFNPADHMPGTSTSILPRSNALATQNASQCPQRPAPVH